ncbi:RnfABCDGE type electron transport complex subunit B [Candidatus Berkiella cookevillensis]|uniref:Electron transport complex protein rnfB n=1 Tax=Candidatus Berkiella cookevillensis TaxID=437022 RepID=A0A0Q9YTD1_9GAMM|nr:RnfABCDGE type electron transport complex subunit B [Candidatus Berkiella cookevillensis]MCS5708838.1 RnfABCDGE type electron transport complex subunit B [Candidatus Berkiella cookevillensis]
MKDVLLTEKIEALLPQTQCEKCGFKGCNPYAKALAENQAEINLCQPGGNVTMRALAKLLHKPEQPLAEEATHAQIAKTAVVQEEACIGCTKCIKACPVDAIIGTSKKLHVVISDFCTGCELCLPVCPVDCIDMVATNDSLPTWIIESSEKRQQKAKDSKLRFEKRNVRIQTEQAKKQVERESIITQTNYKDDIAASILRVKAKRKDFSFETNTSYE